MHEVARLF